MSILGLYGMMHCIILIFQELLNHFGSNLRIIIAVYRIYGIFGGGFNLAVTNHYLYH